VEVGNSVSFTIPSKIFTSTSGHFGVVLSWAFALAQMTRHEIKIKLIFIRIIVLVNTKIQPILHNANTLLIFQKDFFSKNIKGYYNNLSCFEQLFHGVLRLVNGNLSPNTKTVLHEKNSSLYSLSC
jgi:hypothetical protein